MPSQTYSTGYQQGLSDAQAGLMYDCSRHTQYYCDGYSQGFNYENNSQQQTPLQVPSNVSSRGKKTKTLYLSLTVNSWELDFDLPNHSTRETVP
jgi:hypothetical protein